MSLAQCLARTTIKTPMNYKNLNYEIETRHPLVILRLALAFAMNYKNLNYEIETGTGCPGQSTPPHYEL